MKKLTLVLYALFIGYVVQAQVLRPFAPRYTNTSVRGNIVYVANNIITSNGGTTTENPPGGTSVNNGRVAAYIDADGPAPIPHDTMFRYNGAAANLWKYWSNTAANAPGATWITQAYADGAWPTGTGSSYYYNDVGTTDVGFGGDQNNRYPTIYFRKTFNVTNPTNYTGFVINLRRDDGAVVYINGVEVFRTNLPASPAVITYTTLASSNTEGANEYVTLNLANTAFVNGSNTIAVEVHNFNTVRNPATETDLVFDMQLVGLQTQPPNPTFSSTSADLTLGGCSNVLFAGLYWGASQGTDGTNTAWITGETSIQLKIPGAGSYTTVTSTQSDYHNGTLVPGLPHTGYRCFADITSLINTSSPNGTYWVANVVGPLGIINGSGGWTLVIAYSNNNLTPKNLTVFDGSAIMNGGDPPLYVGVSGFLTPPSGTVTCELGAVVYDGDRVSQDEFSFKQDSNRLVGTYTNMTPNATSNLNDMWNSTITYKGANVTTRNPAHLNTLGYDADIIDVPNAGNAVLGNNQTTASIRFSSPSENYFIHCVSTAISIYNPSFSLQKTSTDLNGGSLLPGDVLRYTIAYNNVGTDVSANTIIADNLPVNVGYVPGSIRINAVAKTDGSGDDQAEYDAFNRKVTFRLGTGANSSSGGSVAIAGSGTVTFDVVVPSSCFISSCFGTTISNRTRIDYIGQTTLQALYDSSLYDTGGSCFAQGPTTNTYTGSCYNPGDTTLINICPVTSITLPWSKYAGYTFHSGIPFTSANVVTPGILITTSGVYYAYFNSGTGCLDTIRINVFHQNCPDLDEDDDGIPDYVEFGDPVALQDLDVDAILNWYDLDFAGRVDYNTDGINDNFDPGADSDNDGLVNFMDPNWSGFVDTNSDGVNDNFDKDKDGIPDFLDRDSDNDGIPDTVESWGVDANADGRIDNFSDADNDGLSQNVDASGVGPTSIYASGLALGKIDTDGDGMPNYLDLDSDNDGIPDILEVYGTDANNNGKVDVFTDTDLDGLADAIDGDVGNDGTAENSSSGLLRTGTDGNNDGRADSYPNKNIDNDTKANPYDPDSDGDGITDVKEAQFTDANWNGQIDGSYNSDGWSTVVAAMGSLTLPNTEGSQRANPYDIDSDDDGIPDNVEGLTTNGYLLPSYADTDTDGIDNSYDNFNGFSGDGIHPVDTDADTVPDYLDSDTDGDGLIDRVEGNDLNFNSTPDDNVTLTGVDTDGDGLDDRFDNDNASSKATSRYMGNGGTTSGQIPPGSITTVQRSPNSFYGCPTERDWRCVFYILNCEVIAFKGLLQNQQAKLNWTVLCEQEVDHFIIERSTDRINFYEVTRVQGRSVVNGAESYQAQDNISTITADLVFYRLKTVSRSGKIRVGNVISLRRNTNKDITVQILPNPVKDELQVLVSADKPLSLQLFIIDGNGKIVQRYTERILQGSNTFIYPQAQNLPVGLYYLRLIIDNQIITRKFNVIK